MRCKICGKRIGIKYQVSGIGPECANKNKAQQEETILLNKYENQKADITKKFKDIELYNFNEGSEKLIKCKNNSSSGKGVGTEGAGNFIERLEKSKAIKPSGKYGYTPLDILNQIESGILLPETIIDLRVQSEMLKQMGAGNFDIRKALIEYGEMEKNKK